MCDLRIGRFLIPLSDRAALWLRICSVSSKSLIQHPSPVLRTTSNSCSRDYLLIRCTEICPVDHCLLRLRVLKINVHPLTSTALLSCRRPLPRPLLKYLVPRSVQLRMCSARNLELLLFFLPHLEWNCHIYTLVGTASVYPAVYGRAALDRTQPVLKAFVCSPTPLGHA